MYVCMYVCMYVKDTYVQLQSSGNTHYPTLVFSSVLAVDLRRYNVFREFLLDCMDLPPYKNAFCPGNCGSIFGNQDLTFCMLALRVDFNL